MKISIYQIENGNDALFENMNYISGHGGFSSDIYRCVYHGDVDSETPEEVFSEFNHVTDGTYQGHSFSVSDVVVFEDSGKAYFCDSIGFKEVDFDKSKAAEMYGIRVLMFRPGKEPVVTWVRDELDDLQRAVADGSSGEYFEDSLIEVTSPFSDNCVVVGNKEAKLIGMKGTRRIFGEVYCGPIFFVGTDEDGSFCGLTDAQVNYYSKEYKNPETFTDEEIKPGGLFWSFL